MLGEGGAVTARELAFLAGRSWAKIFIAISYNASQTSHSSQSPLNARDVSVEEREERYQGLTLLCR